MQFNTFLLVLAAVSPTVLAKPFKNGAQGLSTTPGPILVRSGELGQHHNVDIDILPADSEKILPEGTDNSIPADAEPRVELQCVTTMDSPTVAEIQQVWEKLRSGGPGAMCSHTSTTKCTELAKHTIPGFDGATGSLCGSETFQVECFKAADAVRTIMVRCESNYRAQGSYTWGGDRRLAVY
ncbi:hypothetical protein EDC01DRAFT_777925 [Geopyxis carbonaria]|nr:hypothetical protein EDC01DRAFT_777925 [Geopyxis carbonaria]